MKWKFLLLILLNVYISYSQAVISGKVHIKNKTDSSDCPVHFKKYEIGKRFYFPKITEKGSDFKILISYKFISADGKTPPNVYYDTLSEKTFKLHQINDQVTTNKSRQIIDSPYYLLKAEEDGLIIKYSYNFQNLRNLKDEDTKISLILPEAIYLDEVDNFRQKHLNKELFANFPLKEKKYRKITVIDVTPGTKDKPIHITYSYDYQKTETKYGTTRTKNIVEKDSIDVCDCGTNILPALIPNCKFSNYFLTEDPQTKIQNSDLVWDAIMEGKVIIGMKEEHVTAALGKPLKVETENKKTEPVKAQQANSKTTKAEKTDGQPENVSKEITKVKTMTYKNYIVVLENETVTSTKKIE
ncbi:hypothetical protein [Flavobacterium sp. CSZ]|uniref:hypothetical protein n=1 Tax=Flavobacterium sp. CSZ TaxID=2783791 RepID=UPI00188D0389|nr:hypothetical protein [Flavobacterium sp. CSZ]MBF4487718.1 hypothetical protein [Flavobacterium sp. CSZ]